MNGVFRFFSVISATMLCASVAHGGSQACTMEGKMTVMGQHIEAKDCVQASDKQPVAKFRSSCESFANMPVALGGEAGKITYSQTCPENPQGICSNVNGQGLDFYYYKRTAELLDSTRKGCALSGGTWKG